MGSKEAPPDRVAGEMDPDSALRRVLRMPVARAPERFMEALVGLLESPPEARRLLASDNPDLRPMRYAWYLPSTGSG